MHKHCSAPLLRGIFMTKIFMLSFRKASHLSYREKISILRKIISFRYLKSSYSADCLVFDTAFVFVLSPYHIPNSRNAAGEKTPSIINLSCSFRKEKHTFSSLNHRLSFFISKRMRQGITIPLAPESIFTCHFFCFLFLCSENALPYSDAFEKTIINHFEMSRPAHQRSVIT